MGERPTKENFMGQHKIGGLSMRLQKENVQRVVESPEKAEQMLNEGWREIVEEQAHRVEQFDKLNKEEIMAVLTEKGIDFDKKAKKEELIQLLEGEQT